MSQSPVTPLRYDPSGCFISDEGISENDLLGIKDQLIAARAEVLEADLDQYKSGNVPPEKDPLDAGFLEMPERLLQEYADNREESELGKLLAVAEKLRNSVDRVVLLGIGGSYMGARALMEACCHPYHNELSRAERGGTPRLYFEGNNVDNDATAGLLDLLADADGSSVEESWGIVVISKSGGTLETAVAFRQFVDALENSTPEGTPIGERIVPVTGKSGKLFDLAAALGCPDVFFVPDGVGGRFSILSAVGLLPAAILGLDVVALLRGAAAMNQQFRDAAIGQNPVLDYVGVCHLLEKEQGINLRVLSAWAKSLESVGLWYDQLLAESIGKNEIGATPLTVVNTRDLHSRAQQHQEGSRDKVMTNLILDSWRRDPLAVGFSDHNQDQLNDLAEKTLPEIMSAAITGTNEAYAEDQRPTADLYLPKCDEASIGQFFQMMMLATVVEGRLIGVNPYGQPGVEKYKKNMNKNLDRG